MLVVYSCHGAMSNRSAVILQTHGIDFPNRLYAPIFYAMTAEAMEVDTMMWYTMNASAQLEEGMPSQLKVKQESDTTLQTMIDQATDAGVDFSVCHQSLDLHGLAPEDLIEEAEVVGAAQIVDLALEADFMMYF